jgi:phosphotriesterase-related protein
MACDDERRSMMAQLITTLGPKDADELGMILPHEHIFVDLRPGKQDLSQIQSFEVVGLMAPEIGTIKKLGVSALVECTPVGCGRRVDFVKAVSEATGFPIVVTTGIYREPWVPEWAHMADEQALYEWMLGELQGEIKRSGVQAAWIKLSAGDDGLTECEKKILRAAARAGAETNAVVGSHTIRGSVVQEQLDILEEAGYTPERFIWIHTQNEEDLDLHLEVARRGAWIEYDAIGGSFSDEFFIQRIQAALDAGLGDHVLLSHDRGWYDPAQPGGGTPKPFTYINEVFLPKLHAEGVDEKTIIQLTQLNPFQAFAR